MHAQPPTMDGPPTKRARPTDQKPHPSRTGQLLRTIREPAPNRAGPRLPIRRREPLRTNPELRTTLVPRQPIQLQPPVRRTKPGLQSGPHPHSTRPRLTLLPTQLRLSGQHRAGKQAIPPPPRRPRLARRPTPPPCSRLDPSRSISSLIRKADLLPYNRLAQSRKRGQNPGLSLGPPSPSSGPNLQQYPRPSRGQAQQPILLLSTKTHQNRTTRSRIPARDNS